MLLIIEEDSVDPVSRIAKETPPSTLNPSIDPLKGGQFECCYYYSISALDIHC